MIKIERTITIHRPINEVFAYLCDVAHGPLYITGQREAHQTSAGEMGVGTTFTTRGKFPRPSGSNEVTDFVPNQRLAWKSLFGTRATTAWAFEPSGDSTRVTFTREADWSGPWRVAEPLMAQYASGQVDHDLGTLKELLAVTRTTGTAKRW